MSETNRDLRIAIIGLGPRALGAIEALIVASRDTDVTLHIDGFDPLKWAGAGPNYSPEQTSNCLLNIPTREVGLKPAAALNLAIGDFEDWLGDPAEYDKFPTRAKLGAYLAERFTQVISRHTKGVLFTQKAERITELHSSDDGIFLRSEEERLGPYDEVLLTLGQPATKPDDQLARWIAHAAESGADVCAAYPDRKLLDRAQHWADRTVAIRGLGLSTMDVLRMLTIGRGGTFKDGRYIRSGQEPLRILPFSLNGQPPAPKPQTEKLDRTFDLNRAELDAFARALEAGTKQAPADALVTICDALVPPTFRILHAQNRKVTAEDIQAWLRLERADPGQQETRAPVDALRENIAIAIGEAPPGIGYVIGQIWRKVQNALRRGFNPTAIDPDTAAAITGFDEGIKRYSYGPPVRSAQELLMLIEAKMVSLVAANYPDIEQTDDGWILIEGDTEVVASVIVDAVIPPANLEQLTEPLFRSLYQQGLVSTFSDGLGLRTEPDGRLIGPNGEPQKNLCLLGRMALGSVIAVDSIHDCFGASANRWAHQLLARQLR